MSKEIKIGSGGVQLTDGAQKIVNDLLQGGEVPTKTRSSLYNRQEKRQGK